MNKSVKISDLEKKQKNPDDIIYYNITIPNNTVDQVQATYNQILQVPILDNPEDYFLSIIRFTIPGASIPILRFPPPTDLSGSYYVTLSYGGNDYTTQLQWINTDTTIPTPTYEVFSYTTMLKIINNALKTSFDNLKLANPGAPPTEEPFMQYEPQTLLFSLYCQTLYDPVVAGGPTIEIYLNNILYYFFGNFPVIRTGNQAANKKDYQFIITDFRNNLISSDVNNPQITNLNQYYKIEQDYSTLYNFGDLTTISFKSCLFMTAPEYTQTSQNQTVTNQKILTDFEPSVSLSDPSGFRSYIQYYPQGQYRLINLTTNQPLKSIDLQITYKDRFGREYYVNIPRNSSVSVKFAFIKKSLYYSTFER